MGNEIKNHLQCLKKLRATFSKIMGNVLGNYGQCFFKPISHAFFQAMQDLYLIGKGVVETCLEPETGLRNIA